MEILANVHGKGNKNDPMVLAEYKEIGACHVEQDAASMGLRAMFSKRMLNRTIVGLSSQMWQQLTGMNVMMYYITYVFAMAGWSCR